MIIGLDLCGDPSARPLGEISLFAPVFEKARAASLGITLHFAEIQASASKAELETLLSWKPRRLGHVIWEDQETKREIERRKDELCLELCLSCNVHAGMVEGGFEGHHFGAWRGVDGVKVSLGVSCFFFYSFFKVIQVCHEEGKAQNNNNTHRFNRQTTWASSAVRYPTNTASLHNTSISTSSKSALWPEKASISSLEVKRKRRGCDESCGMSIQSNHHQPRQQSLLNNGARSKIKDEHVLFFLFHFCFGCSHQ